jgi:DNA-binding response OmpR family regulator
MAKTKIVLAEDDEVLSKVVYEELTEAGFDVTQAHDGEAAVKAVQSKKPDLVMLDLLMPKKHGFDVLKEIKASPATRDIPVIVLTMLGQDEDLKKGLSLGAVDYIVKSQHAVGEICDTIKEFFAKESRPVQGAEEEEDKPKSLADEVKEIKVKDEE